MSNISFNLKKIRMGKIWWKVSYMRWRHRNLVQGACGQTKKAYCKRWNILNKQTKQRETNKDKELCCHRCFLCVLTTNTYNHSAESKWNRFSLFAFPFSDFTPIFFIAAILWSIMIILKGRCRKTLSNILLILNFSVLGISPMFKSVWKTWCISLLCVNACQFCLLIGQKMESWDVSSFWDTLLKHRRACLVQAQVCGITNLFLVSHQTKRWKGRVVVE